MGFEEKELKFLSLIKEYKLENKVIIINEHITRNQFMSILNYADCYISLHRGEGLGLGILEALSLNKPVIATNYGGNVEYMNNKLCYPVSYKLIPADDDYLPYKSVKLWAEPDINMARSHMRNVINI